MVGLVLIGSFDATKIATGETEKTDVVDGVGEDLMMVGEEGVLWWG